MRHKFVWLLPILVLAACRGNSPTGPDGTDALQFEDVTGTYKAVLTTFVRFVDGPRRGQNVSTVCPGEFIVTEQQESVFFAELTMFHQGQCFPVEAEYRGGITVAADVAMDTTFIHPPPDEACTRTSAASTTTYRGTYASGRFDLERQVNFTCTEDDGRTSLSELTERLEGLPPDA